MAPALDWEAVRRIALALPGVVEGTSYGTPAFRVGGKFLSRLHQDGNSLVVRIGMDEREMLMAADPETYYITDHYRDYPSMLVRIDKVAAESLHRLLEQSWRAIAPKRLVKEHDRLATS
ncbi:MAG TPA: MmcQ/YjbR family DNA-binding protein [Aliidongia sp.]|nr:MmcQ/YjbR family DNA-binding protein [Aliidongia sp.]